MPISIIGAGVVGTATGKGLTKLGHNVIFYDVNENRSKELIAEGYEAGSKMSDIVASTSVSFVCVQTPTTNDAIDLTFVKKAIVSIAKIVENKSTYHLVVVRSTLLPGTMRKVILPLLHKYCTRRLFDDYGICYNPEFLREASALKDFLNPSRIVIGTADSDSGRTLEELYLPLTAPIVRTDFDTAEMIKCVSNAFLATKISFFNEMYMLCEKLGINDRLVSDAVSLDPRIGEYGVFGGKPFSDGCLPKDTKAFARFIRNHKQNPDLLEVVLKINSDITKRTLQGRKNLEKELI